MNIKIWSDYNCNFKTGLSKKTLAKSLMFNVSALENSCKKKNVGCYLNNDKFSGTCLDLVLNIFTQLSRIDNMFLPIIPNIQVYTKDTLLINTKAKNFCIPQKEYVIKNKKQFEMGSLFFHKLKSLEELDEQTTLDFKENKRSSGHFLADYIHEFLHSIYLRGIYSKYNSISEENAKMFNLRKQNNYNYLHKLKTLEILTLSNYENNIIKHYLGSYAIKPHNQYHEIFAETFTKIICNSLSSDSSEIVQNPYLELKKYPKEFLDIIKKILLI